MAELGYGNLRVVKLFCWHIAHHIYNLQAVLDADRFVVSGGITNEPMFSSCCKRRWTESSRRPTGTCCTSQRYCAASLGAKQISWARSTTTGSS